MELNYQEMWNNLKQYLKEKYVDIRTMKPTDNWEVHATVNLIVDMMDIMEQGYDLNEF